MLVAGSSGVGTGTHLGVEKLNLEANQVGVTTLAQQIAVAKARPGAITFSFATRAGPAVLPSPGWFSTITGWPHNTERV